MKNMKRFSVLFAAVMIMVMSLAGCGSDKAADNDKKAAIIGNWGMSEVIQSGQSVSVADAGIEFTWTFNEDGTATAVSNTLEIEGVSTWELDGDKITIQDPSGFTVTGEVKDGEMYFENYGQMGFDMVFVKQ